MTLFLGSNHCSIIIQCYPKRIVGRKLFRFEAFWVNEECNRLVNACWECPCDGDALTRWQKKINDCQSQLFQWSRKKFKLRGKQIKELLYKLGELKKKLGSKCKGDKGEV